MRETNFRMIEEDGGYNQRVTSGLMTVFASIDRGRNRTTELTMRLDALADVDRAVEDQRAKPEPWPFCLPICPRCERHICSCTKDRTTVTRSLLQALKNPRPTEE